MSERLPSHSNMRGRFSSAEKSFGSRRGERSPIPVAMLSASANVTSFQPSCVAVTVR